MFRSKLLSLPTFTPLPCTVAADVNENIDLWLDNKRYNLINDFLRPDDKGYRGVRFVISDDFREERALEYVILRVPLKAVFTRYAYARNHFCPLWFSVYGIHCVIHIEGIDSFIFKSDNDLKKRIREYKRNHLKH